jgi:hypothetical protein
VFLIDPDCKSGELNAKLLHILVLTMVNVKIWSIGCFKMLVLTQETVVFIVKKMVTFSSGAGNEIVMKSFYPPRFVQCLVKMPLFYKSYKRN